MNKLNKIKGDICLAPYTTFKIGGEAKHFFMAKSKQDLIDALSWSREQNLPYFILGGGSNVLISDRGFDGLVIYIQNSGFEIKDTNISAGAGASLSQLVKGSINAGLTGLEWAAGIPGTVGGAVRGNAGAFGSSMADIVSGVESLKLPELKVVNYNSGKLDFGYKHSVFKNCRDIISTVELRLGKGNIKEIKKKIEEHLNYREQHQPLNYPSAGCIFKNPPGKSAGRLIEQAELKGAKIGGAMISKKHANFIVNSNNAKAADIKKLIDVCKQRVNTKFAVNLNEEIEYVGKF